MEFFVNKYYGKDGLIHLPLESRNHVDVEVLPSSPVNYVASPGLFMPDFTFKSLLNSDVMRAAKIHQKEWAEAVMMLSATYDVMMLKDDQKE